jgi:hypothetical protein
MKRITKILLAFIIVFSTVIKTKADEGMWLPLLLGGQTYQNMINCGLR